MVCDVCGEQAILTVKLNGFAIPLCKTHESEYAMNESFKQMDRLLADMNAGKPANCSSRMRRLAKKIVESKNAR